MKKIILLEYIVIFFFETIRSSSEEDPFKNIETSYSNESAFTINTIDNLFYIRNFDNNNSSSASSLQGNGSSNDPFIGFYEGLKEIELLLENSTNKTIVISLISEYYYINKKTTDVLFDRLSNLTILIVPHYIQELIRPGNSKELIQNCTTFIKKNKKSKIIVNLFQENFQINIQDTILFLVNLEFCGRDLKIFSNLFQKSVKLKAKKVSFDSIIESCLNNSLGCCSNLENSTLQSYCQNKTDYKISRNNQLNFTLFYIGNDSKLSTLRSDLFLISCDFNEIISSSEASWFFNSLIYVSLYSLANFSVYIEDSNFENLYFSEGVLKMNDRLSLGENKLNFYFLNSNISNYNSHNFSENKVLSYENPYQSPMILKLLKANAYIYNSIIKNLKNFLTLSSANLYILSSKFYFYSTQNTFMNLLGNSETYWKEILIEGNSNIFKNLSTFIDSTLIENKISMNFMKIEKVGFEIFIRINENTNFKLNNSVICDSSMVSFLKSIQNNNLGFFNVSFSNFILRYGIETQNSFIYVSSNNRLNLSNFWATNFSLCTFPFIFGYSFNSINISDAIFQKFSSSNYNYHFMDFVYLNSIIFDRVFVVENKEIKLQQSNSLFIKESFFNLLFSNASEAAGFVLLQGNIVEFENSSFISIYGLEYTGLFYAYDDNYITINQCYFEELLSLYYAAFSLSHSRNTFVISQSQFNRVDSRLEGGFFYLFSYNTIVMQNNKLSNGTSLWAVGGFAYLEENNDIAFMNSTLTNFYSEKNGGVIYSTRNNEINLINSTFSKISSLYGGVFYFGQSTQLSSFSCIFSDIIAERTGGVIFSQLDSAISFDSCIFQNLFAYFAGGSIYLDEKNIFSFSNSTIINSQSVNQPAGAFFIGESNNISITNNHVYNTSSSVDCGGFYFVNNNSFLFENNVLNLSSSIWEGGGLSFGSLNYGSIISSYFVNLHSENKAGSIFFESQNLIHIIECVFENSTSIEGGGFFYLVEDNLLNITNTKLLKSQSDLDVMILFAETYNHIYFEKIEISDIFMREASVNKNFNFYMGYESIQKSSNNDILQRKTFLALSNSNFLSIANSLFKTLKSETIIVCSESQLHIESTVFLNITATFNMIINYFIETPAKTFFFYNNTLKKISTLNCLFIANTSVTLMNVNYNKYEKGFSLFFKGFSLDPIIIKNSYFINFINNSFPENYQYGGFIEVKNSKLIIKKSNFINGRGMYGGAIYTESSTIYITKTIFLMNQAFNYGGAGHFKLENALNDLKVVFFSKFHGILNSGRVGGGFISIFNQVDVAAKTNDKSQILDLLNKNTNKTTNFEKSKVILNKGQKFGGAFYFLNIGDISFNKCDISKNLVGSSGSTPNLKGKGGSLTIKTGFDEDSNAFLKNISIKVNLTDCLFSKNRAFIGGFLFWEGAPLNITTKNSVFLLNYAKGYGSLRASNTHSFKFIENPKYKSFVKVYDFKEVDYLQVNNLKSGNNYSECLAFIEPLDFYKQFALFTDETFPEFQNNMHHNFSFLANYSYYCLDGLLIKKPGGNYSFSFEFDTNKYFNAVPLKVNLNFRQCLMGERLTDDLKCLECPVFTYSFNKYFTNTTELCKTCENENFNCYGGNKITPKPGYWRLSIESDNFLKCPNEQACLGDPNINSQNANNLTFLANLEFDPALATGKCEEGYQGILCFSCSLGYGRDIYNPKKCSKCATGLQIFLFVFLMILKTAFIIWSINEAIKMCITISSDSPDINKVITNNLLKIFFNHFQTLALIFEMPVKWPVEMSLIQASPIFMSAPITHGLSFECIIREWFPENLVNYPTHYFKLIYNWFYPLFLVVVCLIYLKIYSRYANNDYIKKLTNASLFKYFKRLLQPLYCIILMISYCESIQIVLQTFSCIDVGYENHPHYVMRQALTTECWTNDHYNYSYKVALPFCIIFGICFPLYLFLLLLSEYYLKRLDRKSILFKYGYFYYGLEPHYFFWDFLILIRKTAIIALGIFYLSSLQKPKNYMILIGFLILATALYMQIYFKPYREKINIINKLELKSLIALTGSIFIGIFCLEMEDNENQSFNITLLILMIIMNFYFLMFWIHAFIVYNLKFIYLEVREIISKYLGKFINKLGSRDILIPEETVREISFYQNHKKSRRQKTFLSQERSYNYSIDDNKISENRGIEMVSHAFKEEISNKNHVIYFRDSLEESSQKRNKRRFGKTLDNLEKMRIKRRLLFYQTNFDEINIDEFKKNSFDEENQAFIIESNDDDLSGKAQRLSSNIKLLLKIIQTNNEILHIILKVINENPNPIGKVKIDLENNSETESNVIPLEILEGIGAYSEEKFKIAIKYKNLPYCLVICRLIMDLDSQIRIISFPLPHTIYHYLEFESISLKIFKKTWKILCIKAAVLGPFENSQMLFQSKDEISRIFNNKLVEYEIPYYRREGNLNSEKFGLLFKFKPKNKRYLMKIKKDAHSTKLEFCVIDANDCKSWEDFYIYEVLSYLLVKD